jgi:general secretion pathway protein H
VVCVIAIVAALAALALPRLPLGTSHPRLEAYAVEAASLMKADRTAAMRRRAPVDTQVNATSRSIRSGATGRSVRLPADVRLRATLPQRCNNQPALSSIRFFPSGMSCGGAVMLTRGGAGFEVRVNWLTGGVEIVPRDGS